jgi:predicted aspartyl protease
MRSRLILALAALAAIAVTLFAQNKPAADVPFKPAFRGIAFVSGSLNHVSPLSILLDTGAGGSSVNRRKAEELRLKMVGGRVSVSADPSLEVGVIQQATIAIGDAEITTQIATVPLDGLEPIFGQSIDVIAGGDLLGKYIVEFDYERERVAFFSRETYRYISQGGSVPITVYHGIPYTELAVRLSNNRLVRGKFLIDTGAGGVALQIYKVIAEKSGWLTGLATISETAQGIGGTTHSLAVRATSLEFGLYKLARPPLAFTDDYDPEHTLPGAIGLVGIEVLSRFRLTFDYGGQRLYLAPNGNFHSAFIYNASGLSMRSPSPQFREKTVSKVVQGSPAASAGLQAGDTIINLDGVGVEDMTLEELRMALYGPGRSHRLRVRRDGQVLDLLLKTRDLLP